MIKKTIKVTTITASKIDVENGAVTVTDLPPVITTKNVNDKNVSRIYRNESECECDFKVTSYKTENITYTMDNETFMKYATIE